MPIVQISLFPGRTPEKKEELIRNVTNAIADTLRIPKERVHIILNEVPKENIGHGGVPILKQISDAKNLSSNFKIPGCTVPC